MREQVLGHTYVAIFWLPLLLGIAFAVVSYLLAPKPKTAKPPEVTDIEDPTADFREKPVVFGTLTITGPEVLWFGDKSYLEYEIDAETQE